MTNSSSEETINAQVGTFAKHSKPIMQKSLPCSYDSWTDSASSDTVYSLTQQNEGRTYNTGIAARRGKTLKLQQVASLCIYSGQDIINIPPAAIPGRCASLTKGTPIFWSNRKEDAK